MNLKGKTALVTGGARRIGREISLALASRGVCVLIHYNRSAKEALRLRDDIRALGGRAETVSLDFFSGKSVLPGLRKFTASLDRRYSPVDILINNASVFYPTPLAEISESAWDEFLTVNLKVPFFLAREIGVRMLRRKTGKIINLADWTAQRPYAKYLPYCISKGGLITATKGLAKALAPCVQVNAIAPGPILRAEGMTRAAEKAVLKKTLLGRFGHPRDIARTVLFLCESTDFITGAVIPVEGGSLIA